MALADHDAAAPRKPSGTPCSVQELLDSLDEDDRATLHSWMYELGYSQEVIYASIRSSGRSCGKQTINRHRARACRCFL